MIRLHVLPSVAEIQQNIEEERRYQWQREEAKRLEAEAKIAQAYETLMLTVIEDIRSRMSDNAQGACTVLLPVDPVTARIGPREYLRQLSDVKSPALLFRVLRDINCQPDYTALPCGWTNLPSPSVPFETLQVFWIPPGLDRTKWDKQKIALLRQLTDHIFDKGGSLCCCDPAIIRDVREECSVRSSHGGEGDIAFRFSAFTGICRDVTVAYSWEEPLPVLFDIGEYRHHYGKLDDCIDVLDIGYWQPDGRYIEPDPAFREDVRLERISSLMLDENATQCPNADNPAPTAPSSTTAPMGEALL